MCSEDFYVVVKVMGIEPMSESIFTEASPSADHEFNFAAQTAHDQAE